MTWLPGRRSAAPARSVWPWFVLAVIVLTFGGCASRSSAEPSRNILWRIVSECLDSAVSDYCATCLSPIAGTCGADRSCRRTTDVWAETTAFVAIRDIKMCGCPDGFVHGLALPRTRVTGVEDPRRPAGIWPFAWAAAASRIDDPSAIALVVNPPDERTQDQLHVHLVRLGPDARSQVVGRSPARVDRLDQVWDVAARRAAAAALEHYGILVARDTASSAYLVLVQRKSPEYEFTATTCK